ncbi:MAG: LysR substrate-binding domain-containing protein [Sphingobium sp.]
MDRIDRLRAFIHAAEAGSFAAAGRRLCRSRDNVSKLVADLEAEVGRPLFARSTRLIRLTEAGEAYLAEARPLIEAFDRLDDSVRQQKAPLSGRIALHAPTSFGLQVLAPLVGTFLARHPGVSIDLSLEDRPQTRLPPGIGLALRISDAPPAGYHITSIGPVLRGLFAAPAYLAQAGTPSHPMDLSGHRCLHYAHLDRGERWSLFDGPLCERVDINGGLSCNTGLALAHAAAAGAGIAILPHFTALPLVAEGRLETVLERWRPAQLTLFTLIPATDRPHRRITALLDFLTEHVAKMLTSSQSSGVAAG